VACLALNGGGVAAAPAGWTSIAAVTAISSPHVFGYYRVAGSAEPAAYGWTVNSAVANGGGIARSSGVDPVTPLDVAATTASGSASKKASLPGPDRV
jgi:hypothetical protein